MNGFLSFGDLGVFDQGNHPRLLIGVSCATTGSRKFVIRVRDNREGNGESPMTHLVRWWAIPMTQDLGRVDVPPLGNLAPKLRKKSGCKEAVK